MLAVNGIETKDAMHHIIIVVISGNHGLKYWSVPGDTAVQTSSNLRRGRKGGEEERRRGVEPLLLA